MIVIYKIFHLICFRRPMGLNLANITFTLYAIVSTFVVVFRNRPIAPWDFTALGTAMDVAANYDIHLNYIMIFAFIVDAMLYLVMRCVPRDKTKINKWYTAYPIIVLVVALFFNSIGSYYLWDIRLLSTFQNEGTTLTFTGLVRQFLENQPTKPDGYSEDKLNALKEEYSTKAKADAEADEKNTKPTTIIQIMNESFSDLDIGGTTIAEGMTPYFNSLENTIRGNLYVSVRGGGTCNTEYETLTGNSTAFFQAGVSELSMACICIGMSLHGGVIPACATFFVFSDYMKPAIRMAALMEQPVKFIWSHDAFRVGEDGPTHEPVEQEAQIRLMEKLKNHKGHNSMLVLRPADAEETTIAWKLAMENVYTPTALILSRQNIANLPDGTDYAQVAKGAYVIAGADENPDVILVASGSEVSTLVAGAELLRKDGVKLRIVSAPSEGLFRSQDKAYQESVLPTGAKIFGLTAGLPVNLQGLAGANGKVFGLESFGFSAPYKVLDEKLGFTAENVYNQVKEML